MSTEVILIKNAINEGSNNKIIKQDDEILNEFIAEQVESLFLFSGQTPLKDDVLLICREIIKDLQMRYKYLTLKEIEYCFAAGIREQYGEYYGINVKTISKWLRTYYNSDDRREAMQKIVFPEKTAALLPEYKISNGEITVKRWEQFKVHGFVRDANNTAYNYLDSKKLIPFTVQEKNEMMDQAEKELRNEAKTSAKNIFQVGEIIDKIEDEGNEIIKRRAKRIAVNAFFARLVDGKTDLTELL
jgi:hypothetical protein